MSFRPAPPLPPHRRSRYRFYWWRRFGSHKNLPVKSDILDKLKNGDFGPSPYWDQARWEDEYCDQHIAKTQLGRPSISEEELREIKLSYIKRKNKLLIDAQRDELNRIQYMEESFTKYFGISKERLYEFIEECDGCVEELFNYIKNKI